MKSDQLAAAKERVQHQPASNVIAGDLRLALAEIDRLQAELNNRVQARLEYQKWSDAISGLYLCHACQPKLERAGQDDEDDEE